MPQATWTAVDDYVEDLLVGSDPVLEAALSSGRKAGFPEHQVSPSQGKLLQLLALSQRATRILELGTLAGYSTIWLARGLRPGGRLWTLEADPAHAAVARANFVRAGLDSSIELLVGPALETLPRLAAEEREPFDLVFIDADKPAYPDYLDWALRLARPGGMIVADNVVRDGAVLRAGDPDPRILGVRRFHEKLSATPGLDATVIQTVGRKGYDGFALAVVAGGR